MNFRRKTGEKLILFADGGSLFYPVNADHRGSDSMVPANLVSSEGAAGQRKRSGTEKAQRDREKTLRAFQ
jgi:hypothetical protein